MAETVTIQLYFPGLHEVLPGGTIRIPATGKDKGGWKWSGNLDFNPTAPDYAFWQWLVVEYAHWDTVDYFSAEDLSRFQQEYAVRTA